MKGTGKLRSKNKSISHGANTVRPELNPFNPKS